MIRVFNSVSRKKETFTPLVPGQVTMYVCGVTVYDHSHMGHARSAVVFDMIRRYLRFKGYQVKMVKNFTDIDDKIIKRSQEEKLPWEELTQKYIDEYHHDMNLLKVETPSEEPKATEYIPEMIALIQRLEKKEMAYLSGGDVYYRVAAFKSYGQLSKRDLSLESAGVRVEVSELKENPLDFVLWKSSKPGEPSWDSPWGKGRPGWHIECSAMAMRLLGDTIDIHGGGEDLLFPHHENEIAQSEASTGKKFVNTWIHNGFVTVNQEKMSKSLGNFFTINEVFDSYSQRKYQPEVIGEIIRYFLLSTHYRQPVQFSDQALSEAHSGLNRFYELLSKCRGGSEIESIEEKQLDAIVEPARKKFEESMDDDFNTPEAIGALHSLRSDINKESRFFVSAALRSKILNHFLLLGEPLGLFTVSPDKWQFRDPHRFDDQVTLSVGALIQERAEAKLKRDFKKADQIRKELSEKGIILEDHSDGTTTWKR